MTERARAKQGEEIGIALLGCGTVGGGLLDALRENQDRVARRVGARVVVRRVLVRDASKARTAACDPAVLTTDADAVLADPAVDVVVELMGGLEPAGSLIGRAIERGLGVVTANKSLLADRGPDLLARAAAAGIDLAFEAAVGGAIPVVRTLRDALTGERVRDVSGIVNGTCNFLLTEMSARGLSFDEALAEASARGYAEADPSLDVDGHDAAHKLVVLAMLAFDAAVPITALSVEGVRELEPSDHTYAARFGFRIKPLVIGRDHGDRLELRVHPALVPHASALASVDGVLNAVTVRGATMGPCVLSGLGAGARPTAASVLGDVVEVARARREGRSGAISRSIVPRPRALVPAREAEGRFFLRFVVADRPNVLAAIAKALGARDVSIEQLVQHVPPGGPGPADVAMVTHRARRGAIDDALAEIARHDYALRRPRALWVADE